MPRLRHQVGAFWRLLWVLGLRQEPRRCTGRRKGRAPRAGPWCYADLVVTKCWNATAALSARSARASTSLRADAGRPPVASRASSSSSRVVPDEPDFESAESCRGNRPAQHHLLHRMRCVALATLSYTALTPSHPLTDTCNAFCSNGWPRGLKDAYRCSIGPPFIGFQAAASESDIGQHIKHGHAAVREKGRPAIPEDAFKEQYDTLLQNDIVRPRGAGSVSCRKPHRESTYGHYTPGLDERGRPKLRTRFMVPCVTSSDCYSRCGTQPSRALVCRTKNGKLYRYVINSSVTDEDFAINTALAPSARRPTLSRATSTSPDAAGFRSKAATSTERAVLGQRARRRRVRRDEPAAGRLHRRALRLPERSATARLWPSRLESSGAPCAVGSPSAALSSTEQARPPRRLDRRGVCFTPERSWPPIRSLAPRSVRSSVSIPRTASRSARPDASRATGGFPSHRVVLCASRPARRTLARRCRTQLRVCSRTWPMSCASLRSASATRALAAASATS